MPCIVNDFPDEARLARGRAAVTACPGQDECGSCASACAYGAIKETARRPAVDFDLCIGCGACVKACPRGNMRLVDGSKGEFAEITVKCAAEDLPEPDGEVRVFSRNGKEIGAGKAVQAYPLPDGKHGIIRFRAKKELLHTAAGAKKLN